MLYSRRVHFFAFVLATTACGGKVWPGSDDTSVTPGATTTAPSDSGASTRPTEEAGVAGGAGSALDATVGEDGSASASDGGVTDDGSAVSSDGGPEASSSGDAGLFAACVGTANVLHFEFFGLGPYADPETYTDLIGGGEPSLPGTTGINVITSAATGSINSIYVRMPYGTALGSSALDGGPLLVEMLLNSDACTAQSGAVDIVSLGATDDAGDVFGPIVIGWDVFLSDCTPQEVRGCVRFTSQSQ